MNINLRNEFHEDEQISRILNVKSVLEKAGEDSVIIADISQIYYIFCDPTQKIVDFASITKFKNIRDDLKANTLYLHKDHYFDDDSFKGRYKSNFDLVKEFKAEQIEELNNNSKLIKLNDL